MALSVVDLCGTQGVVAKYDRKRWWLDQDIGLRYPVGLMATRETNQIAVQRRHAAVEAKDVMDANAQPLLLKHGGRLFARA